MNCADAVARLSAALDGELAADDARDVRQHLDVCDACTRRYRTLQQVRAAVRATPLAPVDAARFDADVLARVRRERASQITGAWMAAAAALVIGVSSAVLMLHDHTVAPPRGGTAAVLPAEPSAMPGWNEGRGLLGLDCAISDASTCVVEAPPGLTAGD